MTAGSDGVGRNKFPMGHRRSAETETREADLHTPPHAGGQGGAAAYQPEGGQSRPRGRSEDHC